MSEWLTLSQTAGTGNATITITASTYDELQNRVRTLTASTITKKKTVTVRQYSRDGETISVSPIILNYGYLGNDIYTVTVTSDYNWTIECSPWLSTNILSGSGNGTFTVKADPNAGGDRTGFVRVSTRDITVNVTANQDANVQLDLYAMLVYSGASASLFYTKENVYKIRVDGGEWFSPASTSYNFGTEGEHFVDVTFRGDYTNSIPPMLCSGRTNLVRVFIPNGYYEIHERAFEDCDNIYELSFGDTIYKIDDYAFSRINRPYSAFPYDNLTNIVFGNGLEEICDNAFSCRPALTSVTFNNQLKRIGCNCFGEGFSLTDIYIPNSVELIDIGAFYNCTGLTSVTLNYGLKYIGMAAFDMCAFSSITIPNSVKRVDYGASEKEYAYTHGTIHGSFSRCDNLTSIVLPNSIEGPLLGTFYSCDSLTSCTLSNNINRIGAETFFDCVNLYDIIIPNSVEYIGPGAFQGCNSFQTITIPDSVKEIGTQAFALMSNLAKCYIGSGVTTFANYGAQTEYVYSIFWNCLKLKTIISYMLQEPTYIHYAFNGPPDNDYTPVVVNPSAVSDTFKGVATGGILYHPSGSDYSNWLDSKQYMLGYYSWNDSSNYSDFQDISLDKYYINITGTGSAQVTINTNSAWSFVGNGNGWAVRSQNSGVGNTIITISFPNEPEYVNTRSSYYRINTGNDFIYLYFTQNRTVKLYSSFTAYYNVSTSGDCRIVNNKDDIYSMVVDGAPYDKNNLDRFEPGNITFNSGGQHIIEYTVEGLLIPSTFFVNTTKLTKVITSNSIVGINSAAFSGSSLQTIELGNSINFINDSAFRDCTRLTSIVIPNNVEIIDWTTFSGCTALTSVTLSNNTKRINNLAFGNCTSLSALTLPSTFEHLEGESFSGCTNLKTLYVYASTEPYTDGNAFEGMPNNGTLHYPSGSDYSTWLSDLNSYASGWTGVADL